MSFSLTDLEKACLMFEQKFHGGKKCKSVRQLLTKVVGGNKRKQASSSYKSSKLLRDLKGGAFPMTAKKPSSPSGQTQVTYADLIDPNKKLQRCKEMYAHQVYVFYQIHHKLYKMKNKIHVPKPMSSMPWHAVAWKMFIHDMCSHLVMQDVLEMDLDQLIYMVLEIQNIISENELLQSDEFPSFYALLRKIWNTMQQLIK